MYFWLRFFNADFPFRLVRSLPMLCFPFYGFVSKQFSPRYANDMYVCLQK